MLGLGRLRVHLLSIFVRRYPQTLGGHVGLRIFREQRLRIQVCGGQPRQARLQQRLGNFLGMKLALDPILKAHLFDALQISRTGAVPQPIQRVQDGLIFG